jgi:hypothetical protein
MGGLAVIVCFYCSTSFHGDYQPKASCILSKSGSKILFEKSDCWPHYCAYSAHRRQTEETCGEADHFEVNMMGWFQRIFRGKTRPPAPDEMPEPFMEHPTGDFESAIAAMEDAIFRLRALPTWDQWITFSAQGEGHRPDSYDFAEIRMLCDKVDIGDMPLDVGLIVQTAGTEATSLTSDGAAYSVAGASPREIAHIFDAIFRHHFGLRPFEDEGDDYAVGAEW